MIKGKIKAEEALCTHTQFLPAAVTAVPSDSAFYK